MSDSDATEWVTIKVHEAARDAARDDPRTYTEILRDGLDSDGDVGDLGPFGGEVPDVLGSPPIESIHRKLQELQDMNERNRELFEQVPERTADELEGRLRR